MKNFSRTKFCYSTGFTLIELLVVMAILGILATVGISSFMTSQMKSRDAKRKSDLEQVQRAVELFAYDHDGLYPNTSNVDWGEAMVDPNHPVTVYMQTLPNSPRPPEYCYVSDGTTYQLYARLENIRDPAIGGPFDGFCSINGYNYGVSSSNSSPGFTATP